MDVQWLVSLIEGREQQDAVAGLERYFDLPYLLPDVLRRALYDASAQIGKELRSRIIRDRYAASQTRPGIGSDLLHGIDLIG